MNKKHLSLVPDTGRHWPQFVLDIPDMWLAYRAPNWKQILLRGSVIQEYPRPLDDFEQFELECDREGLF